MLGASALAGIVLAAISTWVHHEVTHASAGYASFCNVNDTVNCDTVVTSPYGMLLRVPGLRVGHRLLLAASRA